MDFHRVLSDFAYHLFVLTLVQLQSHPHPSEEYLSPCDCDKRSCATIMLSIPWWHWAALATTSFTREARTIAEQVLSPSLTSESSWQTNSFSRERHSILLFYRREIGAE